ASSTKRRNCWSTISARLNLFTEPMGSESFSRQCKFVPATSGTTSAIISAPSSAVTRRLETGLLPTSAPSGPPLPSRSIPSPSPFLTEDRTSLRLSAQDSTRNGWLTIADELSNLYRASLGSFRISERANVSLKNLLTKRLLSAYL